MILISWNKNIFFYEKILKQHKRCLQNSEVKRQNKLTDKKRSRPKISFIKTFSITKPKNIQFTIYLREQEFERTKQTVKVH